MKKIHHNLLIMLALVTSGQAYAAVATPTEYTVTLSQVEMHKAGAATGAFTTYASGSTQVNIASVGAGRPCGSLAPTGQLTPGQYDQFRFTLSRTMVVKGASSGVLSNGVTCRTTSSGALVTNPYGDGSVSEAYLGATDGAAPEPETVIVPTGSAVTMPAGFVTLGSNFQATMPMSMNVLASVPQGTVSFNVTNAVDFEPLGATQCLVFPAAPTVTLNVA